MMDSENIKTPQGWVSVILRHFTTFVVILGFFWIVAKPHAEEFVRATINDRISLLEYKLDYALRQLTEISTQLDRMEKRK